MPDVLLIQPPIQDFYLTAKRTVPYGLASIAAVLRHAGFSAAILDGLATDKSRTISWPDELAHLAPYYGRVDRSPFSLFHHYRHYGYSIDHLARQAKKSGAFLIGISSLFTAYSDMPLNLATAVKKQCPAATIVLGGHHPTALPETVMENRAVDYVLRGDGEVGMPLLARAICNGSDTDHIPGLVKRNADGGIILKPPVVVEHLDRLPMPALDLINWHYYRRNGRMSLAVTAGRGCPHRCTYCAVNAATHHGFRRRKVASVMAELDAAAAIAPIGFIDFEDEHLTADRAWFLQLLDALAQRFGDAKPELRAMNGLFAPTLDDALIRRMAQCGFKALNLALITTDRCQLKRFGRPDVTADIDRVIDQAAQIGVNSVAYLIVAGPKQTAAASMQDLLYLARRPVLAGVSVFYPAPGSADYGWCQRKELLPEHFLQMRGTALPLTHETSRRQTATLLRLGRLLNFMKGCLDRGRSLPQAASPPLCTLEKNRQAIGNMLLAAFFKDGMIYGVNDDGGIYPHAIDTRLSRGFARQLHGLAIKGSITGCKTGRPLA